ncbi:glycosyltransferase family 2 protein [Paenibacillus sp. J22TS3]|uniref:glycosyltransferase family 2 protein n=1 Tax=Paenibacillus sp. J22TS3 TaxID=2807192 RepID=UPI001B080240|nr:glycosyltransferase family 2 protein [Paenibacillus sp. J22TS3]GIP21685.1 glycosyl transferase [Paenibacillus sp. J22TS3]
MKKTVSVHIVTYNSVLDIEECLKAVAEQSYAIQQVIVVDNASVDGTLEQLRALKKEGFGGLNLRILVNEQNTGFAPAHNQAIHHTDTDYVLVLNPDVALGPHYTELLVKCMDKHPEIGSATGRLLLKANPDIVDSTGLIMNKACRAFDRGAGEPAMKWNQSGEVFGVSGAAAVYSRRMINDISIDGEFFDSDFFAYKEDVDVAWRAQLLGWRAYYHADAIAYHERGWKKSSRNSIPLFIRQASYINRFKMIYKNEKSSDRLKGFIYRLPFDFASSGYFLLREPAVLGAWKSFMTQLPQLKKKRAYIQQKRRERDVRDR